ncbi:ExbD/TolR family protein [Synechocystis sp. PCC 7509]|uniref:ExbD/TolR family protein n=1 Tax=Synechocystis sp. PCC 7509 TaxID=927677 RepID=UPI0002AC3015|nr:biopolymer transporter ExbD [Synechocystis sp. PCC 7509]
MKINLHSPIEEVQIQIIPLIDVIFCILTFFLLAALQFTRQQAINVDLPKANTSTTPQTQQRLIVTIDPVGQIYVEQQPINLDQLPGTLQTYFQANPNALMVLNASRTSSYDDVVQVLDTMRQVGGDRVALATLPPASTQTSGTIAPNSTIPVNPGAPLPTTSPLQGNAPLPTPPSGAQLTNPSTTIPVFPTAPSSPQPSTVSPQR